MSGMRLRPWHAALTAGLLVPLAGGAAARLAAQGAAPLALRTFPAPPSRGSVVWLLVQTASPTDSALTLDGSAAGEPLHFERLPDGGFRSLVGIPLDGGDTMDVSLHLSSGATTDTIVRALTVTHPAVAMERLTVAPRYAEPDSAALERIAGELAQSRAISRQAHDTPRLWAGRFASPRPSRITSTYGTGREFNGHVTSRHLGTDYAGSLGAPVRAPARAVVALVADFYLAGHAVYLDHGGGLVTGYFHLSQVDVVAGDTVARGQRIGAVGQSGRATGPHLHWIARYGGITVDPTSLFRLGDPHHSR
jgi:murein DD-endopeptidase MepM/ murein hydrolase activator NlpD